MGETDAGLCVEELMTSSLARRSRGSRRGPLIGLAPCSPILVAPVAVSFRPISRDWAGRSAPSTPPVPFDTCRCDGRPLRAQHHHRPGHAPGHPPLDRHAAQCSSMIVEPERHLATLAKVQDADHLLVRAKPGHNPHLHRVLTRDPRARQEAREVMLEENGQVPWNFVEYALHLCDIIMVMTVDPWKFGGQAFCGCAQDPARPRDVRATRPRSSDRGGIGGEEPDEQRHKPSRRAPNEDAHQQRGVLPSLSPSAREWPGTGCRRIRPWPLLSVTRMRPNGHRC